jgi:hypothetical protein
LSSVPSSGESMLNGTLGGGAEDAEDEARLPCPPQPEAVSAASPRVTSPRS